MSFLSPKEFELFNKYGNQNSSDYPEAHEQLRELYDKLGVLVEKMRSYGYIPHIRRNPQNQGQKYETYHWAQLTPEYSRDSEGIIFFVVDFTSNGLGLHIDSNERQGYYANETAEDLKTWDKGISVERICEMTQQEIVEYIREYCDNNRRNFLLFGKEFKIKSCIKLINMEQYYSLLSNNFNLILTGAPGTGKTFLAKEIANYIGAENERFGFIQFHPSYDYTDFIEGLRPIKENSTKEIGFQRKDGIFMEFCRKALKAYQGAENKEEAPKYVFIIDEINRGELSKIFGELFFSIDPGYRGKNGKVFTQYSNLWEEKDYYDNTLEGDERKMFYVPENVYIIGTMNDIDRSVESMDFAFRRRFAFKEIKASENTGMLDKLNDEDLKNAAIQKMNELNAVIEKCPGMSSAYHVGASYFLKLNNYEGEKEEKFKKLWDNHICVLLQEYLRGLPDSGKEMEKMVEAYNK